MSQSSPKCHHTIKDIDRLSLTCRTWITWRVLFLSHLLSPALKPPRGDGVDVNRCVNEQHDGEDIRPLLHCPHVGCAGAGQYSRGIAWKGATLTHRTQDYLHLCEILWTHLHFLFLLSVPSPTRWTNMPRSCLQPWVQAWRRKTIQVSWQCPIQEKESYISLLSGSPPDLLPSFLKFTACWCNFTFSFLALDFPAGKLITLEAMSGLSKVLLYLDKKNVHLLVVYIFMKIKPFLESVSFLLDLSGCCVMIQTVLLSFRLCVCDIVI